MGTGQSSLTLWACPVTSRRAESTRTASDPRDSVVGAGGGARRMHRPPEAPPIATAPPSGGPAPPPRPRPLAGRARDTLSTAASGSRDPGSETDTVPRAGPQPVRGRDQSLGVLFPGRALSWAPQQ